MSHSSSAAVVTLVSYSSIYFDFTLCFRNAHTRFVPFIRPLSVCSVYFTSESDLLSWEYLRPLWLQRHSSCDRVWSESTQLQTRISQSQYIVIILNYIDSWMWKTDNLLVMFTDVTDKLTNSINSEGLTVLSEIKWVSSSCSAPVNSSHWDTYLLLIRNIFE